MRLNTRFLVKRMISTSSPSLACSKPTCCRQAQNAGKRVEHLISPSTAVALQESPSVKFLDASWHMSKERDPIKEFISERIEGAQYFDIDKVADLKTGLPHMLPSTEFFQESVSKLGINSSDHVIVYTTKDCFSAARAWWMFKVFGHHNVSVLNGGLNGWKYAGGCTSSGPVSTPSNPGAFEACFHEQLVVDWKQVLEVTNTGMAQILDARSSARFHCQAPEPRPGLEGGHIPGSLSLPFNNLLIQGDFTTFRSPSEMKAAFEEAGLVFGAKAILSCGSGVTASVLAMGLHILGYELSNCPVYDGSWTEWGGRADLPKSKD